MPEILLPDTSSITSSTASSLLLYTDHQHQTTLTRRKSLPLRRLSVWLSRRISKQGLNATYDNNHNHTHARTQDGNYTDYDAQKIMSDLTLNREHGRNRNRKIQEYEAERNLSESYAAYCRAFTSAGEHLYHQKRRTWMMDGEADLTMISEDSMHAHGHPEDEGGVLDEKREIRALPAEEEPEPAPEAIPAPDTKLELELSPPPHILTPSLYVEMRRAASDKKRARKRLRERRLWSWFTCIRQRESR
ncbi:uncharacterized protein P174DRAFT_440080 [Aspergillus novofumigatus IBT 16806]|uniref:Uncharacterized protein n=1 Tax=Aspergillus novofumigatus (strain IBT 16806) TaxID=1392255 RepID=A0A2I1CD13_ASPN1|nr:uncharacterized protein P174DRAFT_440080 [Aspergillus novofumigatus IBT 16806]PKX95507.1 hypothetical protein P174DRAFT_440080 [Aspergillus novofumigatus IBT 16806]